MPAFIQSFEKKSGRGYQTLRTMPVIAVQAARCQQSVENRQLKNIAQKKSHGRLLAVYKDIMRLFLQCAKPPHPDPLPAGEGGSAKRGRVRGS
jgi:hypothetical protein